MNSPKSPSFQPLRRIAVTAKVVTLMGLLSFSFVVVGITSAPAVGAVSVIGEEEAERYVGSGAVLLPKTVDRETRTWVSRCAGCRWKVTTPCMRDDPNGDAVCLGSSARCPDGGQISRAWLARPGGDFESMGLFCPSDGAVTSVAEATAAVRGTFERYLPPLRIHCAPDQGVVVGIPVHCRSLQPSASVTWVDSIAGYSVQTSAEANWQWTFRQAAPEPWRTREWTHHADHPGARYPGWGIRQAFTVPGVHAVEVRARWAGSFSVDGVGPFAVTPDLEQTAVVDVPTGSALGIVSGAVPGGSLDGG